jgi:pilus assembly protein CpaC
MRGFSLSLCVVTASIGLLSHLWTARSAVAQTPEAAAVEDELVVPITAHRTKVEIVEKFTKVFETKNRIVRVNGFDPVVLSVTALSPNRISVTGEIQGVTSFVITDETGTSFNVEIFVKGDARTLQTIIDRKFPNSSIEAFKVQEAVALRGWVTHPEHITQIVEIAEQFYPKVLNQMRVGGVQQVLLKVRVMEAQRSLLRELGMNFTYLNRHGYLNSAPGSIVSLNNVNLAVPPVVQQAPASLSNATASFGIVDNEQLFHGFVKALREEALLKILAEPEVVATNGRPATLLSGGEFPILVPQSLGTNTIMWREFGVRMEATPIVLGGGALRLELQPEVSDRDFSVAVTTGGIRVPGLTVRRVNTQVEMKFGQTLMLAGLISNRQAATTSKVPFFGELPYVGAMFRRNSYQDTETEVVITVTPELVAPLDDSQVPAGGPGRFTDAPTDRELMGYGLIEVPKYGEACATCGPGQPGPYIVPGLKEGSVSAPPAPAASERRDVPTSPNPLQDETSARSRRFATEMAARQKATTKSTNSGVRQVGFADGSRSTRSSTPPRSASAARSSVPAASEPSTNRAKGSSAEAASNVDTSGRATFNINTTRNNKPGLIEPSAR